MDDDDDALLAGVTGVAGADEDVLLGTGVVGGADGAERAAARERQAAAEAADADDEERAAARERQLAAEAAEEDAMALEDALSPSMPKKVGKRKILKHTLGDEVIAGAVNPLSEEELAKRAARAAKFGVEEVPAAVVPAPAPAVAPETMLTMETILERRARAEKFEVAPVDPLMQLNKGSSVGEGKAFWEGRRDAGAEEEAREAAVHVFGTDKMSSEDLLLYFSRCGLASDAQWVEWVNDSSANVVFADSTSAYAALEARTVPLLPDAQGIDAWSWRTTPEALATAGRGLQLLFRVATFSDVKPAKRAASRWYGEKEAPRRHSGGGGKSGGAREKRGNRRDASAPYGNKGKRRSGGGSDYADSPSMGMSLEEKLGSALGGGLAAAAQAGRAKEDRFYLAQASKLPPAVAAERAGMTDLRGKLGGGGGRFERRGGDDTMEGDDEAPAAVGGVVGVEIGATDEAGAPIAPAEAGMEM